MLYKYKYVVNQSRSWWRIVLFLCRSRYN